MKAWRTFVALRRRKMELGRAKYGTEWSGGHPLWEALGELLDAGNYYTETLRRGELGWFGRLLCRVLIVVVFGAWWITRRLLRRIGKRSTNAAS